MRVRIKHAWSLMGGAGGWEVWECNKCRRSAIPTPFGFLWPWPRCKPIVITEEADAEEMEPPPDVSWVRFDDISKSVPPEDLLYRSD